MILSTSDDGGTQLRQDLNTNLKRWFQDDYFDLFTWQNDKGQFISFSTLL
jgi:hypothetical protein